MNQASLIIYTLVWLTTLGGLVYSQSNLATASKEAEWMMVRTCGSENEEFNLYANQAFVIKKSAIQALSHVIGERDGNLYKPGCSQILMVGNRSLHVWGKLKRILDRINPNNDIDEERWK